jgi:exodeoxyribonuclease VII large subunit
MMTSLITVEELNLQIKNIIESEWPKNIKLKGEIKNMRPSKNNLYVVITDKKSEPRTIFHEIRAVIWNWAFSRDDDILGIKEGEEYEIYGKIDVYSKNGSIQIVINKLKPIGMGKQFAEMLKVKNKLEKDGLFDKKNKSKLPSTINKIGILTAAEGAAVTDILTVLKKNDFGGTVIIKDCIVQGNKCPYSVITGIIWFEKKDIDVLIITRGGGSDSDLMGYSDESLVRSIAISKHVTISAIGHERDNVLSDRVADYRAATPSVAAELVSKHWSKEKEVYNTIRKRVLELKDFFVNKKLTHINNRLKRMSDEMLKSNADDVKNKIQDEKNTMINMLRNIKDQIHLMNSASISIIDENGMAVTTLEQFNKSKGKMTIHFIDGMASI